MKKLIALLLAAVLCLSLAACGKASEASSESSAEPTESAYADVEACAGYAIEKLKTVLKNPASLQVNSLSAVATDDSYIYAIDYSAENSFGGMNRSSLYLDVYRIENGFAARTYGTGAFYDEENQQYTAQFYLKYCKVSGSYMLDPETFRVTGLDVTYVDDTINQRVQLVGKMKGEKGAGTGYEGAWDFQVGDNAFLQVVYFAEGTDLSWYTQFTGFPYEITISAIKDENGHYYDAEIVEDTVRYATDEERFQRFDYYDRIILAQTIPSSGCEVMDADAIHAALDDHTFSMRNNYGGDGDGTHSITFYPDGTLDAHYTSDGTQHSMYDAWEATEEAVVLSRTTEGGKTSSKTFTAYRYDGTRILLIGSGWDADASMVLTAKP